MNGKDIIKLLDQGIQPVVIFNDSISWGDCCDAIENNFKGKIVSYTIEDGGKEEEFYIFKVDIGSYEKYNDAFTTPIYYNESKTYKETGMCKDGYDYLYLMPEDDFCKIEDSRFSTIYERYKKSNIQITYVEWLENELEKIWKEKEK